MSDDLWAELEAHEAARTARYVVPETGHTVIETFYECPGDAGGCHGDCAVCESIEILAERLARTGSRWAA